MGLLDGKVGFIAGAEVGQGRQYALGTSVVMGQAVVIDAGHAAMPRFNISVNPLSRR